MQVFERFTYPLMQTHLSFIGSLLLIFEQFGEFTGTIEGVNAILPLKDYFSCLLAASIVTLFLLPRIDLLWI